MDDIAPLCTVCIANYNGMLLLDDCLASVFAQQGGIDIEVIVHDDASSDASVAMLRERYPQVELLASAQNVGFCISNNRMVARARGEFVLLLNNDAALHPDAVVTLLAQARAAARPGIFSLPQYDWSNGDLVDRGCLLDPFYNPVPNLDPLRRDVAMVIGACLFVSRSLWNQLGGFPDWMDSIAEDLYLCCQARLRGFCVQVAPGSGYRHRQGASFGGNRVTQGRMESTFRRRRLSERNKTAAMLICTPTWLAWWLLMLHLLLLSVEGLVVSLWRRDRRIWREIYAATVLATLGGLGSLRQRRGQQQALRAVSLGAYLHAFTTWPNKLRLLLRHGMPSVR